MTRRDESWLDTKTTKSIWIKLENGQERDYRVDLSIFEYKDVLNRLKFDPRLLDFDISDEDKPMDINEFLEDLAYWKDTELD